MVPTVKRRRTREQIALYHTNRTERYPLTNRLKGFNNKSPTVQAKYQTMENETQESNSGGIALINSFCEITSSTKDEALFFLESHNWDLDTAVSTFYDDTASFTESLPSTDAVTNPILGSRSSPPSHSPDFYPSQSPSRSRSPSPSRAPYALRSRRSDTKPVKRKSSSSSRGVRTISDLHRPASDESDSDSDEPQELFTGGENSGMLVHFPRKGNDFESMFNQLAQSGAAQGPPEHLQSPSSSKSFTGRARLLSGESGTVSTDPEPLESVTHSINFWRNGFSVDDGPLRRLDDPQNAPFLESIRKSECPKELEPADRRTSVHVSLVKLDEDYPEPIKQRSSFQGLGRSLGSSSSTPSAASEPTPAAAASLNTAPLPSRGLVLDESLPLTSIQLRLADGTRMVSRFNHHHTIRDIRVFIDASRPGGPTSYQLQVMGFPPKQLTDLDQTIEQAGIANSVVIQRL